MRYLLFFCFLATAASAAEALSPRAKALIAPVHDAYVRVEREQARLPPAKNDSERLIRLGALDQAARDGKGAIQDIDLSNLPPAQRTAANDAAWDEITRHDLADQAALKAMLPRRGWFRKSRYGAGATEAAFLIVQHAVNDTALQHATLAAMKPLLAQGEADAQDYALLYDRVEVHDGRPQLYATQMMCKDRKWALAPLADPAHADARRKAMGFALNTRQNFARFANLPPCGGR